MDDASIRRLRMRARATFVLPRYRYRKNLQLLNDALAVTEFRDHYWISFGLLLGWARDRRPIPWDFRDADFAFRDEDRDMFVSEAIPALIEKGFSLLTEWKTNEGEVTEYVFYKDKARFEFFEMAECPAGEYRYYSYGERSGSWYQMPCVVRMKGLESIEYLGRRWLKPEDHDDFLTQVYGEWRVPDPGYDYALEDRNIEGVAPYERR